MGGDLNYNFLSLSAGDVDGDGNAELVTGTWGGQLLVLDGRSLIVERGVQLAPLVLSDTDAVTQILAIDRTDGSLPSIYALADDNLRLLDGRDLSLMGVEARWQWIVGGFMSQTIATSSASANRVVVDHSGSRISL